MRPQEPATVRHLIVETPESVAVTYRLAGLGSRGAAALIDTGLLAVLVIAEAAMGGLFVLGLTRTLGAAAGPIVPWVIGAVIIVMFVTYWGYFIVGEVTAGGRTPGKRVMGIRVVRDDGGRVGVFDSIIRNVVRAIDLLPGTYAVGIVSVLLSPDGKRLGDLAAGTAVIEDAGGFARVPLAVESNERISLVADYLERRDTFTPEARYQVAVALLALWAEEPGALDEPHLAGRLADLAGLRDASGVVNLRAR